MEVYNKDMKSMMYKKIILASLIFLFVGNILSTNFQTFDVDTTICHTENIHTQPCAIVSINGVVVDFEEEASIFSSAYYTSVVEFEPLFISPYKSSISHVLTYKKYVYKYDSVKLGQLPRSHI